MVSTPIVIPCRGTLARFCSKEGKVARLSRRVLSGRSTTRVRLRRLAAQYGVSRVTIRNALIKLANEQVLESVVGSGWHVTPHVLGEPPSVLQTFPRWPVRADCGRRPRS